MAAPVSVAIPFTYPRLESFAKVAVAIKFESNVGKLHGGARFAKVGKVASLLAILKARRSPAPTGVSVTYNKSLDDRAGPVHSDIEP